MAQIYLAPDEEITSVIERLKSDPDPSVVLVVPKGASLLQSIVNVRLLKKKADALNKILGVVTNDSVSKHLAAQAGITIYQNIQDVPKGIPTPLVEKPAQPDAEEENSKKTEAINHSGIKIKHYSREDEPVVIDNAELLKQLDEKNEEPEDKSQDRLHEEIDEPALPAQPDIQIPDITEDEDDGLSNDEGEGEDIIEGKHVVSEPRKIKVKSLGHIQKPPVSIPGWVKYGVVAIVVLGVLGLAVAAVMIPKASVTLHVPAESINKDVTLTGDPNAQAIKDTTIPGIKHEASASESVSVPTTGKKQVGDKAKGVITLSNSWSNDSQPIAKNTSLASADKSLVFKSLTDVSIPGATSSISNGQVVVTAGKVDVAVEADQPGDQYNLEPTKFSIQGLSGDKAAKITGSSNKAMSGGTTKELTVVSANDIEKAKNDATTKAQASSTTALKTALPKEEMLVEKSINNEVTLDNPDHSVGDEADTVSVSSSSKASGLSVRYADIQTVLQGIFSDQVPSTKTLNLSLSDQNKWDITEKDGTYIMKQQITGQLVAKIDPSSVSNYAKFKKTDVIVDQIKQQYMANSVDVSVNPSWWPFMPVLKSKINVVIGD